REPDVGHEQDARGDLAPVGLPPLADEQVVRRELAPLLLRPLDTAEAVRQALAPALPEQRLDQPSPVARVPGQATRVEPVLRDLLGDLPAAHAVARVLDPPGPQPDGGSAPAGLRLGPRPTAHPRLAAPAGDLLLPLFPGVSGPGQDVAGPEFEVGAE